jgi:predicted CoA-binding protein
MIATRSMSTISHKIPFKGVANADFFNSRGLFAVVGASADREKFGNKVLRCYQKRQYPVVPINQKTPEIEGLRCTESLTALSRSLPAGLSMRDVGVSIITSPAVTKNVIQEGYDLGARHFFLQPGTYDASVDATCARLKEGNFIKSCVLVDLDCHDDF